MQEGSNPFIYAVLREKRRDTDMREDMYIYTQFVTFDLKKAREFATILSGRYCHDMFILKMPIGQEIDYMDWECHIIHTVKWDFASAEESSEEY